MNVLDGTPQFALITLLTGMIAYYSALLSKMIGKIQKVQLSQEDWRVKAATWLRSAILVLILDNVLVLARISASLGGKTVLLLDISVVAVFVIADLMLIHVFNLSYLHGQIHQILGHKFLRVRISEHKQGGPRAK